MNALDENAVNEPRPTGIGPGERLQAARIQKGLSLDDVANRMHLSANILEAIEENNFEEITAPIFVKGYLRAYARIVSLDEDEMIQQYVDYYSEEDPPITSTSNMAPELSVADARIKWTTYLVIVVLAALLAAWWWNKEQNDETPISLDTQTSSDEQAETASAEVISSEIEAVSENMIEPAPQEPAVPDTADTAEPAEIVEPAETVEIESAEPEPAMTEPSESLAMQQSEIVETVPADTGSLMPEPAQSLGNTLIAPSGSDKLRIIVHADTWADIKDSSDYQMVYDLLRADQSLELTGSAPFSVFLGNGHGVEIRFNDEEIDFSPRIRDDNTARLKVGG